LGEAEYRYTLYEQKYYSEDHWDDCYWGCYAEASKNYHSSDQGKLDATGNLTLEIPVEPRKDLRYILEVTVRDASQQSITGAASVVVTIPAATEDSTPQVNFALDVEKQFIAEGESIQILLQPNKKWQDAFEEQAELILQKKTYTTKFSPNKNSRSIAQVDFETSEIERISINSENFSWHDKKLVYEFTPESNGEYFYEIRHQTDSSQNQDEILNNHFYVYNTEKISNIPIQDDNKIEILNERFSYQLGETARFLIRLPFENARALITIEKDNVIEHQIIDIPHNTHLFEIPVDETFIPNAYVSFIVFQKGGIDYKLGYSEIIVDKSEKILQIESQLNQAQYHPGGGVEVQLQTRDKAGNPVVAELSLAVVDESLIALLGNINLDVR